MNIIKLDAIESTNDYLKEVKSMILRLYIPIIKLKEKVKEVINGLVNQERTSHFL